jgi:glycosyltransferase involved in cell wall biosynthesis
MPVYNGERFIREAIDSLLRQDHENLELIVSDNASTDRTAEICAEYAAGDRRVRFGQNARNAGAISNFNKVLGLASADYFMWAAADDLWEPTYVSTLLGMLQADPEAVLAFAGFDNVDDRGEAIRDYPRLFDLPSEDTFQRMMNYVVQEESLGKANLIYSLMRRPVLRSAGGFKVWGNGLWGADMLVVFRILASGKLTVADEVLFHKRLVPPRAEGITEHARISPPIRLARRLKGLHSALRSLRGYVSGYHAVINAVGELSLEEKQKLRVATRDRAAQLYGGEIRRQLADPARRLLRHH